jgi:DNA-binding PucR family transcriptional regulator
MVTAVAELESAPDFRAEVFDASRETASSFLASVDRSVYVTPEIPPALAGLALTLARRGLDPTVLMKLARHGQAVYWPALMELAEREIEEPSVRMRVLTTIYERFSRYMEDSLDRAIAVYQRERDRRVRGAQARRDETIKALLAGEDLDVEAASRWLGHDLRRYHTAFALWDTGTALDPLDRLESLAREVAASLGAGRALMTPSGSHGLWMWLATSTPTGPAERARVARLDVPDGVRVAGGLSADGAGGFCRTHEEALAAQRVVIEGNHETTITWYDEVEVVSLLSHDVRGMRALVARELAGLSRRDALSGKLRLTALAYLRCGGSATAASRELGAHKNTVRYRIQQVEEALGRPLSGQELQLQLALMLVETIGDAALP